ncbi:MAG: serine/threonine-protein kinase RsbW [Solirubrobacteraceae bacterium]|jgi:serine/threonine-protein kinase RsbW/stage II sporulation protein AB (anti-sigma F factor)|nr:serine/threonine-protein kinase RsbW [Solirubrobacteraceae bacterium]
MTPHFGPTLRRHAPERVELVVAAEAEHVGAARSAVVSLAERAGLPGERRADVALAVGEACANAVMHAYDGGPPGRLRVVAEVRDSRLEVVVSDGGQGMAPRPDSPGLGLGLPLMASLASALELRPAAGGGTEVWLCFELVDRAPAEDPLPEPLRPDFGGRRKAGS